MSAQVSAADSGISIREFARRDGCNDKLVRRAISQGKLTAFPDGTIDPNLAGSDWRKTNRRADTSADRVRTGADLSAVVSAPGTPVIETIEATAERLLSRNGASLTLKDAEKLKENYLALLRQLEYDIKSGNVVAVEDIARAVGEEYAKVRTRLLAIPAALSPRLHRLKTVTEVQDALMSGIVEALEELTSDQPPRFSAFP